MADVSLDDQVAIARAWLVDHALPFWGSSGIDGRTGGFHERFDFDGAPIDNSPRRLMVQARQIYVFSHAHVLGWHPNGREIAARGIEHLVKNYLSADGKPGFVFSLAPDNAVADGRRNTYGHAFVLLALAWYVRATGDQQVLGIARNTFEFIQAELADGHGAFVDDLPRPDSLKRQNPHMHLLEGFLALYETFQDAIFLSAANSIVDLFRSRFFDPRTGCLHEYFADDWSPAPGKQGQLWEPGHHFEWSWLLNAHARIHGAQPIPEASILFDRARAVGVSNDGYVHDEMLDDDTVFKTSARAWPLTEAVKAGVARRDCEGALFAANALVTLMDKFVGKPWPGGWIDQLGADRKAAVDYVPASTLYHLFLAIAESNRRLRC